MVRTRNFLIFVGAIGFLVVAIAFTLLLSNGSSVGLGYVPTSDFDMTTATYTAEVAMVPDTRADRLATMRRKLSEIKTEFTAPVEPATKSTDETEVVPETPTDTTKPKTETPTTVTLCPSSRTQAMVWPVAPQKYAVRSNQRVFYTEVVVPAVDASSTPVITETVALTLPLRTEALSFTSCIASPVVAVTTTGLPIRNSDFSKYQGVGAGTLIGYSLDGFEIYGEAGPDVVTDTCGGSAQSGAYRYYLSDTRPGILGCFAGIPVLL
jgi:hypothetical protein